MIKQTAKEDRPTASFKERRLIFLNPSTIKLSNEPIDREERYKILLLSESIRENGLLFPITVVKQGKNYRCVCGNKRVRASILAGKKKIPCIEGIICESDIYKAIEMGDIKTQAKKDFLASLVKKHSLQKIATCLCLSTRELELIINPESNEKPQKAQEKAAKTETRLCDFKLVKDKRFFINSIRKAVDSMKDAGVSATLSQKENSKAIEIKVNIKKSAEDFLQLSIPDCTA